MIVKKYIRQNFSFSFELIQPDLIIFPAPYKVLVNFMALEKILTSIYITE